MDQAKSITEEDNISLNQLFLAAISEKLGELKTRKFFKARGENADIEKALLILENLQSHEPSEEGDQIL